MAIAWRIQMAIDHGFIDADHRCLIDLVNAVDSVQPGPEARREMAVHLDRLRAHTQVHFRREEHAQAAAHFINADAHGRYHHAVIRDLDIMRAECDRPMEPRQSLGFQHRVSQFLNDWLSDHIFRSDALMKPFVADMQAHTAGMVSLAEAVKSREAEFR